MEEIKEMTSRYGGVVPNKLNKQSWPGGKGWSSRIGIEWETDNSSQ